jgi:hypothetical protein
VPDDFEVSTTGLPLYRYDDWRALVVQRWQAAYGPDADTRPETPDGLIVDTLTLFLTLLGEAAQGVYAGSFFRTAAAPQLDLILDFFGRTRLAATSTTVDAIWYGDATTVVWSGVGAAPVATVSSAGPSDGDRYEVTAAGTIPAVTDDGAVVVARVIVGQSGDDYAIDIGGTESVITAATSDVQAIADQLVAALTADFPTLTFTAPGLDAEGGRALIVIQGKGTEDVTEGPSTSQGGVIDVFPAIVLAMSAEETGPQQVLAGTLTGLAQAISGVTGVTTIADGSLGRDVETDAAFRERHLDTINIGGAGTPQRIRAAILDALPSPLTDYVRVDENLSPFTVLGRPAHSFEVTWIGTATAQQVAEVVLDQKPAGIRAWGDTEVAVLDDAGEEQRIGVSEGEELYLHLDIEVTEGEGFPTTGDPAATIQEAVVTALEARLGLGSDLYRVAVVAAVVGAVDGVAAVTVETDTTPAPGDVPGFSAADVTVATNQILRVDSTRVTVTLV